MTDPRNDFDISPQQYHAGLDKLWKALGVTGVQKDDVFTMVSKEIAELKQAVRELVGDLQWCSGSMDFQSEGTARVGWEKGPMKTLNSPIVKRIIRKEIAMPRKTEKEINDIILAWAMRRKILLGQDSVNDLAKEIFRQEGK